MSGPALAAPAVGFLLVFLIVPLAAMLLYSVSARVAGGVLVPAFTLENYARIFTNDLYLRFVIRTLRVALTTTLLCMILSYPLALILAHGNRTFARITMLILVAPLLVNLVIRSYGWTIVLNTRGLLNWLIASVGLPVPGQILYSEAAVVIGCAHLFLPLMVLPLAAAIIRIEPSIMDCGRVFGASEFRVFCHIVLPLSLPGLAAGSALVFPLTAGAYVTPALLGGNFASLLGNLIEQQVVAASNWPFGAALATLLVAILLLVNLIFLKLFERKTARWVHRGR